jgi:pilus assembly protein Flp/PilA
MSKENCYVVFQDIGTRTWKETAMLRTLGNFITDESGATAIEYGLIAALVSVAAISGFNALGSALADVFGHVADTLDTAVVLDD